MSIGNGSIQRGIVLAGAVGFLLLVVSLAGQTASSHAESREAEPTAQDGSAERGRALFRFHCSVCHAAAGIPAAFGTIGPDLTDLASRPLIAGVVPNTPGNLARWLADPQWAKADTAMPRLGLSAAQASDLVAFLLPPQEAPAQPEAPPEEG